MISINATLVVQVIHFLLMMFILNRLMLQPLMRQVREREKHVEQARVDVEDIANEAEQLVVKRISMEQDARKKASQERARLKEEASAEAEGIFEESRKEAGQIRDRVHAQVQEQLDKAQQTLDREAAALADEIVERIAGRRVSH